MLFCHCQRGHLRVLQCQEIYPEIDYMVSRRTRKLFSRTACVDHLQLDVRDDVRIQAAHCLLLNCIADADKSDEVRF